MSIDIQIEKVPHIKGDLDYLSFPFIRLVRT